MTAGLLCAGGTAHATTFLRYDQAPFVYAADPVAWSARFNAAQTSTVRVAMFGDSQETPSGGGRVYMPRLNYEAFRHFGNMPETPLASAGSYGGGSPYGDWMVSGAGGISAPYGSPTRIPSGQILPNVNPASLHTKNGAVNGGHYYGQVVVLTHDGSNLEPQAQIPTNQNYFKPTDPIAAEIFARQNPVSGEINYRTMSSNFPSAGFFNTQTQQGTLNLGLVSNAGAVKSALTPALDFGGRKYVSIEVNGSRDDRPTDFVGVRFRNLANPAGMVFSSFSQGGYGTIHHLNNHHSAGAMFKALDFDIAAIHLGANDAGADMSAAQFHANTLAMIARLRQWSDNPELPIVLFTDPDRVFALERMRLENDRYAGVAYAIAQADPNVLAVNSRRLTDALGWRVGLPSFEQYVGDGVHYWPLGAQALAAVEFNAMISLGASVPEPASIIWIGLFAGVAVRGRHRR